ncbi:ABC transporter ATP-binding protein [Saccharopolyspora hirsuta]|uniref:ABC transporter ATP-binding protein n=1 Tax=Saccharopolyspora hirsuta TaxID=1837 RepID=A0A5M7BKN5_SACHI|nr:ABC transporter ATP-binding protein [Saccharopolyspora hirsuta]KAA5830646.1 ABC transporter ATP-binding protein [Saccharopolyspora hirsuta]
MTTSAAAVSAAGLNKVFGSGDARITALDDVDVSFGREQFTAIMGPSGSGKSTLMHCVAGLDAPTSGQVWIGDTELTGLTDAQLTELRRDRVGFVFQAFNLLPTLTARENVLLPLDLAGRRPDQQHVDTIVDAVGLRDRLEHRPSQLSGGQQQRVALARALVTSPDVVFADEPTGALDSKSSADILEFLRRCVDELGQTVVMVTHEPTAAAHADRVLFLSDGKIVDELYGPSADGVLDRMKSLEKGAV